MNSRYLFLLFFATNAIPGRFFSLFLQAHGLNPFQIGVAFSLGNIVAIFATPFFSVVADKSSSRPRVVLYLVLASVGALLLHGLALPAVGLIPTSLIFPFHLFVRCLFCFVNRPILTILKAICVAQLRDQHGDEGPSRFGDERLYGTISWGLGSLMVGYMLDIFHMNVAPLYVANIIFTIIFMYYIQVFDVRLQEQRQTKAVQPTACVSSVEASPVRSFNADRNGHVERADDITRNEENEGTEDVRQVQSKTLLLRTFRSVILSRGFSSVSFFVLIAVLSSGESALVAFQVLFFHNELHASGLVCGLSVLITVVFEVPLFAHASALLRTCGPVVLVVISAVAYGVRTIGYAVVPHPWMVLLLEPLHGVTFACLQTAGVAYVATFTPKGADATAQAVFTLVRTIASVIGVGIGGQIMQFASGRSLYAGYGIVVLAFTAVFAASRAYMQRQQQQQQQQQVAPSEIEALLKKDRTTV